MPFTKMNLKKKALTKELKFLLITVFFQKEIKNFFYLQGEKNT